MVKKSSKITAGTIVGKQQTNLILDELSEVEIRETQAYVWGWGKNKYGELSIGVNQNSILPKNVKGLHDKKIIYISSAANHSCVVTSDGELLTCGSYLHNKLGIDDLSKDHISKFTSVSVTKDFRIKKAVCGDYHTMALTTEGALLTWGGNLHKKLGNASSTASLHINQEENDMPSLYIVKSLYEKKIIDICCGDFHSVALENTGTIYTWGGGGASYNKG
jgi:alpha-tubulin suppressor-like RCC1 family protein